MWSLCILALGMVIFVAALLVYHWEPRAHMPKWSKWSYGHERHTVNLFGIAERPRKVRVRTCQVCGEENMRQEENT